MTRDTLETGRGRATRWRGWTTALALALCGVVPAGAAEENVTLYQWQDSNGVYRYTSEFDRIPRYARDSAVEIRPGAAPPSNAPVYFDPDPRAPVVAVPNQPPEAPEAATAGAAPGTPPQASGAPGDLDARIRALEARIAADEEALKQLISKPGAEADTEVSPEMREIAARLPRLQAELASLRKQRASDGAP
jgi:uncharacterized coiled-coil protein SlyX